LELRKKGEEKGFVSIIVFSGMSELMPELPFW
jgi:hypothetical protein